jgi:hypothetical protein
MALIRQYTFNVLRPTFAPHLAVARGVRLPVGGPVGVGGKYAAGVVLGAVTTATPANEVRTLTVAGSPTTMTGFWTYIADKTYTGPATTNSSGLPTAAQMQAALDPIFGPGNTAVTYASNVFTITFQNVLGSVRIGGKLTFTPTFTGGSSPSATLATSTQGTAGVGQYDTYASGNSDGTQVPRALLERDYLSDPQGGYVTEHGPTGEPYSPAAFVGGYFRCGDLTGLDANALSNNAYGFRLAEGTDPTNANSVLRVG